MAFRVHLINPPSAPGTTANREGAAGMGVVYPHAGAFLYPPHTLATVAASLREPRPGRDAARAGYDVRASDGVVEATPGDLTQADAVGVFVAYASLDTDLAFLTHLRGQTAAKLIAFGPAMRFVGAEVLRRAPADAVLVGDAEGFFAAALRYLDSAAPQGPRTLTPADVGASCCDEDGLVQDLDALPLPAWDLVPHSKYALLTVLGSRGCPDRCAYCPYAAAQGHCFRARAVEGVLEELSWLVDPFAAARIVFRDPVFAYDRQRVEALCEGILHRGLLLRWECESRPEHFDKALLQLMQRAGCQWVKIGLETTDRTLLQELGRVGSAEEAEVYLRQTAEVVGACREIGLRCRLFAMVGLPGQDLDMVEETGHFVQRLQPAALNVKECESYPGTGVRSEATHDTEMQLKVLQQAQKALQDRGLGGGPLRRSKRWLSRVVHGRQPR